MRASISAFGLSLVVGATLLGAAGQQTDQTAFGQGAYQPGSGVSDPVVLKEVRPNYTTAALQAKIQGLVELEAIVEPNGTITRVRVTKSLDRQFGLDQEAMAAARKWLFKPGYKDGKPVPVIITLILEFRPRVPQPGQTAFGADVYKPGSGVGDPVLLKEVRPAYTTEARRAGIEGLVELEAVVEPDGTIQRAGVTKSLDRQFGLDDAAIAAAKQWLFKPGYLAGKPVPVLVTLIVEFRVNPGEPPVAGPEIVRLASPAGTPDDFTRNAHRAQPGLTTPKVLTRGTPQYTDQAAQMKIEGIAEVEAVVLPDGKVDRARIRKSLDSAYGLDEAAIEAAKQFVFEPNSAKLNGQPVPVVVLIVVEFRLR